jgi:hypothetical protein
MTEKTQNPLSEFFPEALHGILEQRPLVAGESAAEFDAVLLSTAEALKPGDAIEGTFVKDIACMNVEIDRYRSYAAKILSNELPEALAVLLKRHPDLADQPGANRSPEARRLAHAYYAHDADARQAVAKYLIAVGLDENSAPAHAFCRKVAEVEAAMRSVATLEARRAKLLREFEWYRGFAAQRPQEIVEGDFIEAPKIAALDAIDPPSANPGTEIQGNPA